MKSAGERRPNTIPPGEKRPLTVPPNSRPVTGNRPRIQVPSITDEEEMTMMLPSKPITGPVAGGITPNSSMTREPRTTGSVVSSLKKSNIRVQKKAAAPPPPPEEHDDDEGHTMVRQAPSEGGVYDMTFMDPPADVREPGKSPTGTLPALNAAPAVILADDSGGDAPHPADEGPEHTVALMQPGAPSPFLQTAPLGQFGPPQQQIHVQQRPQQPFMPQPFVRQVPVPAPSGPMMGGPAHFAMPDPPATVLTMRKDGGRRTMTWAAALLGAAALIGVVAALVSGGSSPGLTNTTASFVDPSRTPSARGARVPGDKEGEKKDPAAPGVAATATGPAIAATATTPLIDPAAPTVAAPTVPGVNLGTDTPTAAVNTGVDPAGPIANTGVASTARTPAPPPPVAPPPATAVRPAAPPVAAPPPPPATVAVATTKATTAPPPPAATLKPGKPEVKPEVKPAGKAMTPQEAEMKAAAEALAKAQLENSL